jgi:hypothetical protein
MCERGVVITPTCLANGLEYEHCFIIFGGCEQKLTQPAVGGGPLVYWRASMIVFFISVLLYRRVRFCTLVNRVAIHYAAHGWQNPPTRRTLQRRFVGLPPLLPQIAYQCEGLDFPLGVIVLRTLGGLWTRRKSGLALSPTTASTLTLRGATAPVTGGRSATDCTYVNQHCFLPLTTKAVVRYPYNGRLRILKCGNLVRHVSCYKSL